MRGIIASFARYVPTEIRDVPTTETMSVWTSEGVDTHDVTVLPATDKTHCAPNDAKPPPPQPPEPPEPPESPAPATSTEGQ
jgi:hypothetical protein